MFLKILFIILYLISILSIIYGLWAIIPFFYGLPWVPTEIKRAHRALEMVDLKPDELFYDLGAGDGRVILMASEEFGAQAIGIEASPLQYLFTRVKILFSGSKSKLHVRYENFRKSDLGDADVVFAYLTPKLTIHLQDDLAAQLKPGTRVVAIAFDFPDWKPIDFDDGYLLFAYEMPPEKGGFTAYLAEQ